ncbi:MAG: SOS response-associated peptidase family protein [Thiobacillus sp.]|jgi:putative SOS response-associated peptidase YedK
MCGRYALKSPARELAARIGLDEIVNFAPRYNISPGTEIPTIRHARTSHQSEKACAQLLDFTGFRPALE